jgi:hypothetical protein
VNLTFLSTDEEQLLLELIEVEALTTSKTIQESFLLVVSEALRLINNKSELDDLLGLELVLHQGPVGNATITGDGVEIQSSNGLVGVPSDLPDGICVLVGSNGGHVDGLVVTLESDVEDHDSTIIETNCKESRVVRMEV